MEEPVDFPSGRYERKYLVTDEVAVAVRDALKPYVDYDVHMPPGSVRGYAVHSVYYDSPDLELYRQTRECEETRYKLRVRFYDHQAENLAFVEVKQKTDGQVYKRRYSADIGLVESMLHDAQSEQVAHALGNGAKGSALEEFCRRRDDLGAARKLFVSYDREAYNSKGEPLVRITFDRRIKANAYGRGGGLNVPRFGTNVGGLNVLLEFKYTGDPPGWLEEVIANHLLKRASFSKFAECIDALGISGQAPRDVKVIRQK